MLVVKIQNKVTLESSLLLDVGNISANITMFVNQFSHPTAVYAVPLKCLISKPLFT